MGKKNKNNAQPSPKEQELKRLQDELAALQKQLAEAQKKAADKAADQRKVAEANARRQAAENNYNETLAQQVNAGIQNQLNNPWEYKSIKIPLAAQRAGVGAQSMSTAEGKQLTKAGYSINNETGYWEKSGKKATSNDTFDYTNFPAVDDKTNEYEYPMSEITDLVLVDSISYTVAQDAGKSAGWDSWGEPQGVPAPVQRDGAKNNEEMMNAVGIAVHSLLDKGFSDNSMAGNLFGLSVDDIGNAMSVTDNNSASVLKYNYSGYGNPDDLKRNIFEDSVDVSDRTRFLGNLNATIAAISNT